MTSAESPKDNLSNLRKEAKKRGTDTPPLPDEQYELNVHEVELEMQNLELTETREKLDAALKEYWELFELSPVGYFILDKNGIIENVNKRGIAQLELDKEYLLQKPFSIFLNSEHDQDNFYRHAKKAVEEGSLERMECQIRKKNGSVFSAFIKSKIVLDDKLEFKHLLAIVSDISGIKEHERQVELQLQKSEELSVMKSRFVSTASHEFRTPLTSILSSTNLIEQYAQLGETQNIERHVKRIKSSVEHLVGILNDFLSLEKLEGGNVTIDRTNFSLPELCDDMINDLGGVRKSGQAIHYDHAGVKEIWTDKKIMQHILLNLLSNACKYSDEGKEVSLTTNVSDDKITINVRDMGIGIPESEQKHIFGRFFRAENVGNIKGTGLGLNIVKRYVELLGGTIGFTSTREVGTTFVVVLPCTSEEN